LMSSDEIVRGGARALYASAIVGFAAQALWAPEAFARLAPGVWPGAAAWPVTTLVGLGLAGGGLALIVGPARRAAGLGLAGLFLASVLALHVPRLLAHPGNGAAWGDGAITLGLAASALIVGPSTSAIAVRSGRLLYGLALLGFGAVHLRYHAAIAQMIPGWIPARPTWPFLTGAANLAAAAAYLSTVLLRPAAALLGAMFGSWVVIVHLPQVAAAPGDATAWTALLIAVGLCAGAFGLAAAPSLGGAVPRDARLDAVAVGRSA